MSGETTECPVCGRVVPWVPMSATFVPFHYDPASTVGVTNGDGLRVCVAVNMRRDDFAAVAQLQNSRALTIGLDRIVIMVAAATTALERIAAGIEARTAVAAKACEAYDRAMRAMEDDSGPIPAPVDDDGPDDGSH